MGVLKLVLTDHWFEEIKSGRLFLSCKDVFVEFQKAYRKNPEKMTFKIKKITVVSGLDTDLHCEGEVFDIVLGERIR